ncbi:MAG: biopolymer transporter ExbD [Zhongshania sp.]|uniref:ExbD/TolR family protein n=1 Tax=Zhongshania sp. TaxID=1971902 RepID=UPI002609EC14|nr:biopolymer transporter ExbD [Zhongshania sp.]MDF1691231.1 biopolymer transporter ExbD [Zhongshania sp.]
MSKRQERKLNREVKRAGRDVAINVVSLIDIFAILVFYLLVNAVVVEVIPEYQNLKLPTSLASEKAQRTVTVAVSASDILLEEQRIMSVEDALQSEQRVLALLAAALAPLIAVAGADEFGGKSEPDSKKLGSGKDVNIVADRDTPYRLLKKILATCVDANFDHVSLAVREITQGGGA